MCIFRENLYVWCVYFFRENFRENFSKFFTLICVCVYCCLCILTLHYKVCCSIESQLTHHCGMSKTICISTGYHSFFLVLFVGFWNFFFRFQEEIIVACMYSFTWKSLHVHELKDTTVKKSLPKIYYQLRKSLFFLLLLFVPSSLPMSIFFAKIFAKICKYCVVCIL